MGRNVILAATVCVLFIIACADAGAQGFYPREWWHGHSGLFARDYITPSEELPGYLTGGSSSAASSRSGRLVFAAAAVDQRCQQDGSPRVSVIKPPRTGRISVDLGTFVATGMDGGSDYCLGRRVRGTRVYYAGRLARGERIVLRVVYPTKGLTYDHVITTPSR